MLCFTARKFCFRAYCTGKIKIYMTENWDVVETVYYTHPCERTATVQNSVMKTVKSRIRFMLPPSVSIACTCSCKCLSTELIYSRGSW